MIINAVTVAVIVVAVYFKAIFFDFVNFDDPQYIYDNPAIRKFDPEFLKWAFTNSELGWLMPLVWISFGIDYFFWGLNPVGYHLTNILLHAVDSILVMFLADALFRKIFGDEAVRRSPGYLYPGVLLLAGLLFGIHPVHVESVAWAVERKNVLSTLFTLLTLILYLRYLRMVEFSAPTRSRVCSYLLSLVSLILSLMTKPVGVMVPVMLLVIDWCPYKRLRRGEFLKVMVEKVPFFAVAAISAAISIASASGERILVPLSLFPLLDRFILSGYAVFEHGLMLLYPVGIVVLYLIPLELPVSYTIKALAVLALTIFLLFQARRRPWLFATWCCFLLPMLPALHFFLNGACSKSSHFVYLPSIMPIIAFAGMLFVLQERLAGSGRRLVRYLLPSILVLVIGAFLVEHRIYLESWRNSGTLWSRVIALEPAGRAYYYRGEYYLGSGRYQDAVADFLTSVKMAEEAGHPEIYTLYALLGDALRKAGRSDEAVDALSRAIALAPLPNFYYHRSLAHRQNGNLSAADADLARAGSERGPIVWQYLKNRDDLKARQ